MQILANQQKMSLQNITNTMFIICQDQNYCLNVYQIKFAELLNMKTQGKKRGRKSKTQEKS